MVWPYEGIVCSMEIMTMRTRRRQGNMFSGYVKISGTKLFVNQILFVKFMLKMKTVFLLLKIRRKYKKFILGDGIEEFFKNNFL